MRTIEYASVFKRDYKRIKATPKHKDIDKLLEIVLLNLASDQTLLENQRDHALNGSGQAIVNAISSLICC